MKTRPRFLAIVGVLAGLALAAAAAYVYRSSIAVALAPEKSADASQSELAKSEKDAKFWDAFHGGRYDDTPIVLEALTAAYLQNPRDTETAAHIAFTHVWALNEGATH